MADANPLSRRKFLTIAGATSATGVIAGCSAKPVLQKLYPFLTPPEDIIPGTPAYYRTVCRECPAGCGVTAKTREGRVIKLEGNPDDPRTEGALCARGQAGVQRLYSPDRLRGPVARGAGGVPTSLKWDTAVPALAASITGLIAKNKGVGIRLLTRAEPGGAGVLQRTLFEALGLAPAQRIVFEPMDVAPLRTASELLFHRSEIPGFDLARARSVVSFGADFLETWISPVELTAGFAKGRGKLGDHRTLFTWVGSRLSATGASADRWMKARPGSELSIALAMLGWLSDPASGVPTLPDGSAQIHALTADHSFALAEQQSGVPAHEIEALCRQLVARRPSALLGPGISSSGAQATELARAIQLINYILNNIGQTVHYGSDPLLDTPSPFLEVMALLKDMEEGRVDLLLVHHADLLGMLPRDLNAAEALAKVPQVVSFSDRLDATTLKAHVVLPDHHPLESFGDVTVQKGSVSTCQPVMNPIWDTRSASEVLLQVAAKIPAAASKLSTQDLFEYSQAQFQSALRRSGAPGEPAVSERSAIERGGYFGAMKSEPVTLDREGLHAFGGVAPSVGGGIPLVTFPTALRYDGRAGDLPWLREIPDATSTVSWSSWLELSPSTAEKLGVAQDDLLSITSPKGTVQLSAYVYPGLMDGVVAMPIGGPEPFELLSGSTPRTGWEWQGTQVKLERVGRRLALVQMEGVPEPHAGELIKFVSEAQPALPPPPKVQTMYPPPEHPTHRWAMSIDLDQCTGCQACVVACYAENNIPVVGPDLSAEGRNMAWIRIERYFGDETEPPVHFSPMLCQQCDNAPCEPVCPVYATYHTPEGLNAQVYNRCVGTRYCSNNCPYKVRNFNYLDAVFPSPLDWQLNPDVSVRTKGVMEKCTFCVQRIRYSENAARSNGGAVLDGDLVPACAQTCPSKAIIFGDANNPASRVSKARQDPRGFRALEELNTRPAITYLARVKPGKP